MTSPSSARRRRSLARRARATRYLSRLRYRGPPAAGTGHPLQHGLHRRLEEALDEQAHLHVLRPLDLRLSLAHRGLQPRLRLVAAAAAAQPAAALVLDQQPVLLPRPRRPALGLQHPPHAAQTAILNVLQPAREDARLHLLAQPPLAQPEALADETSRC